MIPVQLDLEGPHFAKPVPQNGEWPWQSPYGTLTPNYYRVITADPPWRFRTWNETNQKKSASRHYQLMTLEDIKALPVADLAAPDCVLLMWVVNPMLPQGIETMAAWGFEFKTIGFCWAKTTSRTHWSWVPKYHFGLGYWSRANIELCLLGVRGKPKRAAKDVAQLLVEPIREHSRKPDEYFKRVERLVDGPYCELFGRQPRKGWDVWGNEVKFGES